MNEKGISHSTDIRVRYADTDAMTFVYHGNYLIYFEQARTELLRSIGLPYAEIESMGLFVVVIEAHVQYKRPAQYDDLLHVKARVSDMPASRIHIEYEITRNTDQEIMISGFTNHTFLNKATGKPVRPPEKFIEIMKKYF